MRVLIVGAGIIGSIYGWVLHDAGHEVTHLVRPGRAATTTRLLTVDLLDGRRGHSSAVAGYDRTLIESVEPDRACDLVIVPTKPYQLVDAIAELAPKLPSARFLLLTQNWEGTAAIDAILPRDRYLFGDAHAGGIFAGDRLVASVFSDIVLGHVDGSAHALLEDVAGLFASAGLAITTPPNILHYIWVQFAINAGLWTGLVHSGGLRALLADTATGEDCLRAINEGLDVVRARGVDLADYPDALLYTRARSRAGMLATGIVMKATFAFSGKFRRAYAHGLGDPTEIATAYHAVLATGEAAGLPMTVMKSFSAEIDAFAA